MILDFLKTLARRNQPNPEHPDEQTVNALVIIKVQKQNAYPIIKDLDKPFPGFVIGSIEKGDSDVITAQKEALEEAGILCALERFQRVGYVPHETGRTRIAVFFLEISTGEKVQLRHGGEQAWIKIAKFNHIQTAMKQRRILLNHAKAWQLFLAWVRCAKSV